MAPVLKEKNKNVQLAKEQAPEKEISEPEEPTADISVPEGPDEEPSQEESAPPQLFDLSQFGKDKIETAESLGIPIRQIAGTMNSWAASVEARFQILAQELGSTPQKTIELLKKAAREAQQQTQMQQSQGAPQMQGGGGEMGQVMGVLQALGMGGGGADPYTQMFMQEVIKNGLESMNYGTAFVKAILTRVAPDVASEVSKDITSKMARFEPKT